MFRGRPHGRPFLGIPGLLRNGLQIGSRVFRCKLRLIEMICYTDRTSLGTLIALFLPCVAIAQEFTVELAGIESWNDLGSPNNIDLIETLPDVSYVNTVTWTDVTGSGLGGTSWGQEMTMDINGEVVIQFFPDEASGTAGGEWGPASGSIAAGFVTNELILEFFESFDDYENLIDAQYTGGTITISYETLSDCNGNGIPDAEELGPDTDCDMSGVLDVCENLTDCDANGVPDVCEGSAVPNDRFENAIGLDINGEVSGSTECAAKRPHSGTNATLRLSRGVVLTCSTPSVFQRQAKLICGLVIRITTPIFPFTLWTVRSWCVMVIPGMTMKPTGVDSTPQGSSPSSPLANMWFELVAGRVPREITYSPAHSATCLIAMVTADPMMKTLPGASAKTAMTQ